MSKSDTDTIMRLPPETLDDICCFVDSHSDLVSLATTSHVWASTIIPRHSEYRKIRIPQIHDIPSVWEHLRRRVDLAHNIRSVQLLEIKDIDILPDRYPTTLLEKDIPETADHDHVLESFCTVLRTMQNLEDFTWELEDVPIGHEADVFIALINCHSLKRLRLSGDFARHNQDTLALWKIANLRALSLEGRCWGRLSTSWPYLQNMLSLSPRLQSLYLPDEVQGLSECTFPELKSLGFWPSRLPQPDLFTRNCVPFIEKHPTIEELLRLLSINSELVTLKSDILPKLRKLSASTAVTEAIVLNDKRATFTLERLAGFSATSATLKSLEAHDIDRSSLKALVVDDFEDLDSIATLSIIFPSLEFLFVPQRGAHGRAFGTDEWMKAMAKFHHLKVFLGGGWQWGTNGRSSLNTSGMNDAVMRLAKICPKLEQLDHFYGATNGVDIKRILLSRSIDDQSITWETIDPPPSLAYVKKAYSLMGDSFYH